MVKECIKEIHNTNESFGVYQGQSTVTSLRSLYNKIKSDRMVRRNRIDVHIQDGEVDRDGKNWFMNSNTIDLTHDAFEDFSVQISSVSKDKYEVEIPDNGASKTIVTDEKGVMRIIYNQIKQELIG